ncbi:hypothetical protein CKO41_08820 [Thiococcus pfennigii]|nr:hypothetical protein [Thiococcus pfennigii]
MGAQDGQPYQMWRTEIFWKSSILALRSSVGQVTLEQRHANHGEVRGFGSWPQQYCLLVTRRSPVPHRGLIACWSKAMAEDRDATLPPESPEQEREWLRAQIPAEVPPERRQVIALGIRRKMIEFRMLAGCCACGRVHCGDACEAVAAPAQWGPSVQAPAAHPTHHQSLPFRRSAELIGEVGDVPLSNLIGQVRGLAPSARVDEKGMRVGRGLYWLQVLSVADATAYSPHCKRGREALVACGLGAFGVLKSFAAIFVHDSWPANGRCDRLRALCGTHRRHNLSALTGAIPNQKGRAEDMIPLLPSGANEVTARTRQQEPAEVPDAEVERLRNRYDAVLDAAAWHNPLRLPPLGSRRGPKQAPAYKFIKGLREERHDVLSSLARLRAPFDNKGAERGLQMPKVKHKQKVSRLFRTVGGIGPRLSTLYRPWPTSSKPSSSTSRAFRTCPAWVG